MVRDSRFELLRILSIFFIILSHISFHASGFSFYSPLTLNKVVNLFFISLGKVGVNLFVLISGYFLYTSKFRWSKLSNLMVSVVTASIFIAFVVLLCKDLAFSFENLSSYIWIKWWFVWAWVPLYIFFPYLNSLIKSLDREDCLKLILTLLLVYSLLPTFVTGYYIKFDVCFYFFVIYLTGAYIRRFDVCGMFKLKYLSNKVLLLLLVVFFAVFSVFVHSHTPFDKTWGGGLA